VFQEKYSRFIEALAGEYNDIDKVDFIDAYGLGKWGEGHSLVYKDPSNNVAVMDWITKLYARTFTDIPLVINYHRLLGEPSDNGWGPVSSVSDSLLERAIANGYSLRHDAFGLNDYYQEWEKDIAHGWNYRRTIILEGGWITGAHHRYWIDSSGKYREGHAEDVRQGEYEAGAEAHVNMMDLRIGDQTASWFGSCFDLVKRFTIEGGYRLYPSRVTVPEKVAAGSKVTLRSQWENLGWGYCPVNIPQWNWRYRVGYALLDLTGKPVRIFADSSSDLSLCLKDKPLRSILETDLSGLDKGSYTWAVSLVDSQNKDCPGLQVAIDPALQQDGWVEVLTLEII
jgi:hypothetical protein